MDKLKIIRRNFRVIKNKFPVGFELIPLVDNFLPDEVTNLKFYAEIYNAANLLGNEGYNFRKAVDLHLLL